MTTVLPIEKVAATVIGKHLQLQAPMPKQESWTDGLDILLSLLPYFASAWQCMALDEEKEHLNSSGPWGFGSLD